MKKLYVYIPNKGLKMNKLILIMMFCSLFSNDLQTTDRIKITQNSKVEIYSALFWKPCKEAKLLLQSRGIDFDIKMVTFSKNKFDKMVKRTGGKTSVPQIFVDDKYLGGLLELKSYYTKK